MRETSLLPPPAAEKGAVRRSASGAPHLSVDVFLARVGQREVDAVQRHPVNLLLPARKVPPHLPKERKGAAWRRGSQGGAQPLGG